MAKFNVNIKEVHTMTVEVEAESSQDARSKVNDMLANEDEKIPFDHLEYSHTMPPEDWTVEKL